MVFANDELAGVYELDAATGAVLEYALFYGYIENSDPVSLILANYPQAHVSEVSIDIDDGRIVFEGEALLDSRVYEYKVDAKTGQIVEWERDD